MSVGNKFPILFVRTKAWINTVIICGGVAMITAELPFVGRKIVFKHRR